MGWRQQGFLGARSVGAWSFLAEHHEEALPVAPAVASVAVAGPVAFSCSRYSHLDSGHYFFELVVLASACPGVLASTHGSFWKNFSKNLVTMPASFAPGERGCFTQPLGGWGGPSSCVSFHTVSTLQQTRILKCCSPFSCRTEKRAQSMLLVAVLPSAVRTWKTGNTFTSFTWLTRVMMSSIFRRSVRHFSASSSELRPVVTGSCQSISTSCGHTHPVSETTTTQQQQNNDNNNNTIWRGSVLLSGELNHALSQVGGLTQSKPSRTVSSEHHISTEHRLLGNIKS